MVIDPFADHEISLRMYVNKYTPKGWSENIDKVYSVPYWNKEDYSKMKKGAYPKDTKDFVVEAVEKYIELNNLRE